MMNRDQILATLRERILAFATSRVSRDRAEDLTQEVLTVLHEKYSQVTELVELVPLAFQVLRYKMLDAHRKALRRGEYNQESVEELMRTWIHRESPLGRKKYTIVHFAHYLSVKFLGTTSVNITVKP